MKTKKNDYIPRDKYELGNWATELAEITKSNIGNYGITQELSDALTAASVAYSGDLTVEKQIIDQKRKQVQQTQIDRKDITNKSRQIAQIIKNNPAYSDTVGREFDIIGAENHIDTHTAKPELKAVKVPHGWEFGFGLKGYFNGINIYRKRPNGEKFEYIATDTRSPYVDNSEAENGTQYYAYFILGDTEVGEQSDTITVEV